MKLILLWLALLSILGTEFTTLQHASPVTLSDLKPIQLQDTSSTDLNQACQQLKQKMQQIDATRTTFALENINWALKICLPLVSDQEKMYFLILSDKMYTEFFKVQRTPQQEQAFQHYALDFDHSSAIQQTHFEQLSWRDQYLIQHKNQAYIELFHNGKKLAYRRQPIYLSKIFAPHLSQKQQFLMYALAEQHKF